MRGWRLSSVFLRENLPKAAVATPQFIPSLGCDASGKRCSHDAACTTHRGTAAKGTETFSYAGLSWVGFVDRPVAAHPFLSPRSDRQHLEEDSQSCGYLISANSLEVRAGIPGASSVTLMVARSADWVVLGCATRR